MRLGLVTYNLASEWDVPTIIEKCQANGFEGVELRTTHAHGVEANLNRDERSKVRALFEESGVKLVGLGTVFEFHSPDAEEVKRNIEGTKEYVRLASDVGADGVKVRPNGLAEDKGIPREKTLEQIGVALRECGEFASDYGVQIRLEVHGRGTSDIPNIRKIMEAADHPNAFICWNCNDNDLKGGTLEQNFNLLSRWIALVHMRDLFVESYPWRELLRLLKDAGYTGFCCAEIPPSPDPDRVMKYYCALWKAYLERQ